MTAFMLSLIFLFLGICFFVACVVTGGHWLFIVLTFLFLFAGYIGIMVWEEINCNLTNAETIVVDGQDVVFYKYECKKNWGGEPYINVKMEQLQD